MICVRAVAYSISGVPPPLAPYTSVLAIRTLVAFNAASRAYMGKPALIFAPCASGFAVPSIARAFSLLHRHPPRLPWCSRFPVPHILIPVVNDTRSVTTLGKGRESLSLRQLTYRVVIVDMGRVIEIIVHRPIAQEINMLKNGLAILCRHFWDISNPHRRRTD